jgi:hypothetical protein
MRTFYEKSMKYVLIVLWFNFPQPQSADFTNIAWHFADPVGTAQ